MRKAHCVRTHAGFNPQHQVKKAGVLVLTCNWEDQGSEVQGHLQIYRSLRLANARDPDSKTKHPKNISIG